MLDCPGRRGTLRPSRLAGRSERRAHPGPPADAPKRDPTREVRMLAEDRNLFFRKLLELPGTKESLNKLATTGCDPEFLLESVALLRPSRKRRKNWYSTREFSPDKIRRFPARLCEHAKEIDKLNQAISNSPIYRDVISHMRKLPKANALPPDWFVGYFGALPNTLRQYASVIAWIEKAVEGVARRGAIEGREKLSGLDLIYYVHLTTGKPCYED